MRSKLPVILGLVALLCSGQTPASDDQKTDGERNGRFLQSLTLEQKAYFILGIEAGTKRATQRAETPDRTAL
jgi:hypothetical protein